MKRFVRTAMAAAAMGLVFGASEAQAQVGFSIGGGPTFAMGDFGDAADMGYHVVGAVRFGVPMIPVGLQAEAMWNRWSVTDVDDASWQTLSGSLNAVINLPTPGITPYLIGGVGYYNFKLDSDEGEVGDTNDFGVNVGGGVRLGLPGLSVFAEARLHNMFTEGESTRFVPVTLGIRL